MDILLIPSTSILLRAFELSKLWKFPTGNRGSSRPGIEKAKCALTITSSLQLHIT